MFESTAHQSLFKAKSCTTRFGIIFTRKAKTIYLSINILLKFILSTSVHATRNHKALCIDGPQGTANWFG